MLKVKNLKKKFDDVNVLQGISFDVNDRDIVAIVGPSGSGKSTLLRCLNLIEVPTSGDIVFEGKSLLDKKTNLSQVRAKMGMVFQSFNLFPHLTVLDNMILAPVKLGIMGKGEAKRKAYEYLEMIDLKDKALEYPNKLSGGQKQRIAIVRTLMMNPDIILFDEPTSALDPEMVGEVLDLIKDVAASGKTMIIVSHEMNFVKNVSTRVLFLDEGIVKFYGSNKELFVSNVTKSIEKMTKMTEAAESYGSVGADVASRVMGVEDDIKKTIMKDSGSM